MRRTIAQRLVQSKQTVPHFYLSVTCDVTPLLETRARLNDRAPRADGAPAWKLSINDFVIKAMALALRARSRCQCHLDRGRHAASTAPAMSAVAVAVEGGLFTPVIRAAEDEIALGDIASR